MEDFRIDTASVSRVFEGLNRPECVLCTRDAGIYVSNRHAGVMHIAPDGRKTVKGHGSASFVPNGIALRRDGSLLVANMGEGGGVWQIAPDGEMRPFLMQVDGRPLLAANFVMVDSQDRVWISISTQAVPRTLTYNARTNDGFVVVVDGSGPRIFSEGFGSTNECRLAPDESALYVVETFSRRIRRVPVDAKATPAAGAIFTEFGAGAFPDGATFDAQGHLWVTSIISNRVYRVSPQGTARIVLEDNDPEVVAGIEQLYQRGDLRLEHLHSNSGKSLLPISSIAFGGPDLRTAYLGTTHGTSLGQFRSPVAGHPLPHWTLGARP